MTLAPDNSSGKLRKGSLLDGRLVLDTHLGAGGMGQVWRARYLRNRHPVAVKLLADRWTGSDGERTRMMNEAAAAAQVDCYHVARVFDCAISPDVGPYIVMELVDGMDLGNYLELCGGLPYLEAVTIVAQLCLALADIHAAGLVHRDVKPENVVLSFHDERPCAKLVDFGIATRARVESVRRFSCRLYGTPGYMSPEQLAGEEGAAAADDLWSLAVLAYACLVGRLPFDDSSYATLSLAINRQDWDVPSAERDDLPVPLDAWFLTALARHTEDRFASAADMRESLIEACSPLPLLPLRRSGQARPMPSVR